MDTADGATRPADDGFDQVWQRAARIPGWLTPAQARVLWGEAHRLGPGAAVVEIGSHQGRSTVVLASALRTGRLTALDSFADGHRYGGAATRGALDRNLTDSGVAHLVDVVPRRSQDARRSWSGRIDLLWIDGKHDYWTCSDDLRWSEWMPPGARVLVHDAFSSIGVTLSILRHVLTSRRLRYLGRVGSLARFEVCAPDLADRLRILAELPWWLRNVGLKILLRLRLRGLASRFGHDDSDDPY